MEDLQTLSAPGQVCDKHCNRLSPQLSLALLDQTGRFAGERPVTFFKGEARRRLRDTHRFRHSSFFLLPSPFLRGPSSFDIATSKNAITEVNVDAMNGRIVAVQQESAAKEAAEKQQEAKEKPAKH